MVQHVKYLQQIHSVRRARTDGGEATNGVDIVEYLHRDGQTQ